MTRNWQFWAPAISTLGGGAGECSGFVLKALLEVLPEVRFSTLLRNGRLGDCAGLDTGRCTERSVVSFSANLRPLAIAMSGMWDSLGTKPEVAFTSHINFLPALHQVRRLRGTKSIGLLLGCEAWDLQHAGRVKALREADRLWSISDYTRQRVARELALNPDSIDLLPLTFDHSRFEIREKSVKLLERHGLSADDSVILTVARLDPAEQYKGQDRVIRQLPGLVKSFPKLHYIIAGRGGDQPRLEQLARDCDVMKHVIFAGFVPDEEICDYYNLADVFAMPSTGEGFGIVFLESAVCGRPVIAGNQDASPEATGNGSFGWMVDPDDGNELTHAIREAISGQHDKALLKDREGLRQAVINEFGWSAFKGHVERNVQKFFSL